MSSPQRPHSLIVLVLGLSDYLTITFILQFFSNGPPVISLLIYLLPWYYLFQDDSDNPNQFQDALDRKS